ncbi:hypothetical protein LL965_06190 [Xanthomonas cassavae CFBP 4642]|uniref:Uncharacterized protein n=1 Tax=Xanthomonas cassavae CFBP 4642 TaxID=1219375 RepID=A0ABS8HC97_9XANT|nr:hypothetical protein [Xanthomonas cassavae]MCC4619697.1 hypothetical protein [Xanthomonas cassavae CFBP 4642]
MSLLKAVTLSAADLPAMPAAHFLKDEVCRGTEPRRVQHLAPARRDPPSPW